MAKKQNTNRIGELRLSHQWSQGELAERCGAHWVTISKLERGQMQLTQDWMERLGEALGVHPAEILADPPTYRTVYVGGSIIDATKIDAADILTGDDVVRHNNGQEAVYVPYSLQFGAPQPDKTVWFIVDSEIFYPFVRIGDFVRFTYPASYNQDLFLGRICLVHLEEYEVNKVIGVPTKGSSRKTLDLHVIGKNIISDAKIKDIAYMSMVISNPIMDVYEDGEPKP